MHDLQQRLNESDHAMHDLQQRLNERDHAMHDLQEQLYHREQTIRDLQREFHSAQHQLDEERRHHEEVLERFQGQSSFGNMEFWTVPHSEIELGSEIGAGGWGSVSKGTYHGQAVAVKCLHPDIISKDNISRFQREMYLMAQVRHPHVLLFIGAMFEEVDQLRRPLIILELLDVDLRKAYESNMVGTRNFLPIFRDVACALNYLHHLREPIIHRDVSAPNILLEAMANNQWKAKVSDFGSANLARLAQTAAEGAIIYSPPECLPEELRGPVAVKFEQTTKIDVYSYGVLLCEVITRTLPTQLGQMKTELKKKWSFMHGLADTCTQYHPDDRPTSAFVLNELRKIMIRP